jgi:hypothetical protein
MMERRSMGDRLVWGILGLVVGILIGSGSRMQHMEPLIGFPTSLRAIGLFMPFVIWAAFWALLIAGLAWGIRWAVRDRRYYGRLEDLPADFDDWHRRAHERMREATPADSSGRRG